MFESAPESLPSTLVIQELKALSGDLDVSYNVHLPTDIHPGDPNSRVGQQAIGAIRRVLDLTLPLSPTTFTLHLPLPQETMTEGRLKVWQEGVYESMIQVLRGGIDSRRVSIETLAYPFAWVAPVVQELQLSICLDLGHLIVGGVDLEETYDAYHEATSIIHLHGVEGKQDHLPLSRMAPEMLSRVMGLLRDFSGVVSLEIFSFSALADSLKTFEDGWEHGKESRDGTGCR